MTTKPIALHLLSLMCLWLVSLTAYAEGNVVSIASDNAGTLMYESANGEYFELAKTDSITYIAWNDDGTKLAFIKHTHVPNENDVREIGVVEFGADGTPSQPMILQTYRPSFGYNLSWMQDGRLLFAAQNPETNPETGLHDKIDIMAVSLGNESERLGTFQPEGECGGGSPFPADWRYGIEMNASLGGLFMTLVETPYGILYTNTCAGSTQALLDPATGASTEFATNLYKAVVSPNGEEVAGIQLDSPNLGSSSLVVFELASGEYEVIPTSGEPDLAVWGIDGNALYYSTRTYERNLMDDLSDTQFTVLDAAIPYSMNDVPSYSVTLHHIALDDMQDTLVYQGGHFAIGRIFETPTSVYISVVPNLDMWLSMVVERQISPMDEDASLSTIDVGVLQFERMADGFGSEIFIAFYELFTPFVH